MNNFSVYVQYNDWPILHKHTYWEFLIVTKGTLLHHINGETHTITQNTLCVLRPEDGHSLHNLPRQKSHHITLRVSCAYITNFLNTIEPSLAKALLSSEKSLCFPLKPTTVNRIINSTNKVFTTATKKDYESHCTVLFLDIFRAFYYQLIKQETTSAEYSRVVSSLIYLINNPENLKKDIKTLIQECGYSYSHMNRTFANETGISPSKYLKTQRLHYAKQLLTETDLDFDSLSRQVGYSSYPHFLVAFRKEFGVSPYEYRKSLGDQQ